MRLVCVSQGSLSRGGEFAARLARKLDYQLLTREEVVEAATQDGIPVGRLEAAIVKRRALDDRLLQVKDHFQAFATMMICERALRGPTVYAGRSGHVLLPGVTHVFRVRVVADTESRIRAVVERLHVGREKARLYIERVEEDRDRWARTLYNLDWRFSGIYDLVVNLEQVGVDGATTALCGYAHLPEFQETPASRKALENLLLAARGRVALARDDRTHWASVTVRAADGRLSATYVPKDMPIAAAIPEVLSSVEGVRGISCSMATTNILWVQECFSSESPEFAAIARLAERWNAAVEVLRVAAPSGTETQIAEELVPDPLPSQPSHRERDGWIEDDGPEPSARFGMIGCDDEGLREVCGELRRRGVAGGMRTTLANPRQIGLAIDRTVPYSLVVVGDLFSSKGHATAQRLGRELSGQLGEMLRVPVVGVDELRSQYLVQGRQLLRLAVYSVLVALAYFLVFTHQEAVLRWTVPEDPAGRVAGAAAVLVVVPTMAYLYGTVARNVLRLLRIE